jgi:hypothetical protein
MASYASILAYLLQRFGREDEMSRFPGRFALALALLVVATSPLAIGTAEADIHAFVPADECAADASAGHSADTGSAPDANALAHAPDTGVAASTESCTNGPVGPAATIVVSAPDVATSSLSTITVTVRDASGNPVPDETVTLAVTAGTVASGSTATTNLSGVATFLYVSPSTPQAVNATAIVGFLTGSTTFEVG